MMAEFCLTYSALARIMLLEGSNTSNVSPLTDSGAEISNRVQMLLRSPMAEPK